MNTKFYHKLSSRIEEAQNIIFNGPIYDKKELAFLKTNCRFYIHGHSVGGTNPSLLEALASGCNILVHANEFNLDVVGDHAYSWNNQTELEHLICSDLTRRTSKELQQRYCFNRYNWHSIADKYLELFELINKE